ncbi:rRNA methyltransferase 2, mitochondrial [Culicoides brevitarsis]|uniref:rRNA methyltransferase 2, mitochondrial n=1 Tax=Culicoides brevitarsis TaxID=469753 RepID=UPI00307B5B7E
MITRRYSTTTRLLKKVTLNNAKGKSVSSQMWLQRQLSDPYVEKAKMLSYRCRSAFKLLEIDDKHKILRPEYTVIDCGCSPGSWSQVAAKRAKNGLVIGVDLQQVQPVEGAILFGNTDFTSEAGQQKICDVLKDKRVNCVLSDMAPRATGIRQLDQENIMMLCYAVLRFALTMSEEKASVLMKCWTNAEMQELVKRMECYYETVKVVKPNASRGDSAETFLLGKGFKGVTKVT